MYAKIELQTSYLTIKEFKRDLAKKKKKTFKEIMVGNFTLNL